MIIVKKVKHYQQELDNMVRLECDGWDHYDGRNYQWYSLFFNKDTGLVKLSASNSGAPFGQNYECYFNSPQEFEEYCILNELDIESLFGEVDESDENIMAFVTEVFPD